MDEKKIDKLYDLLERIEMEGDADTAASGKIKPEPLRKKGFLLPILATGIYGSIPGWFIVFPLLVLVAGLPFGVLSQICGGICTGSARFAGILVLCRITGNL